MKRHKVKHEKPEASTSYTRDIQEHDLAYYIHDRVELVHQIFSVIKMKDLRAMAPECVRHISIDDLQELCTEELLGISSKRLCAILDGAEPPSDTESSSASSQQPMETISLDSISSDDEILSESSKRKKKHKHRRHCSKAKSKKKKSVEPEEEVEKSKASRAGLTVLELLELQARARAIRAQLQQEQANKQPPQPAPSAKSTPSSEDEVEIKEEPAEVLVISSSDDEKPDLQKLEKEITSKDKEKEPSNEKDSNNETSNKDKDSSKKKKEKRKKNNSKDSENKDSEKNTTENAKNKDLPKEPAKITKRINDLIITVPQQSTRRIKLNRHKVTISVPNENVNSTVNIDEAVKTIETPKTTIESTKSVEKLDDKTLDKNKKDKTKKKKKKEKRLSINNDSDQDEITLQLSDTEKMDLLEDLDRKNYRNVPSSSSDSDSSSSDSDSSQETSKSATLDVSKVSEKDKSNDMKENPNKGPKDSETVVSDSNKTDVVYNEKEMDCEVVTIPTISEKEIALEKDKDSDIVISESGTETIDKSIAGYISAENPNDKVLEIRNIDDIPIINESENLSLDTDVNKDETKNSEEKNVEEVENIPEKQSSNTDKLKSPEKLTSGNDNSKSQPHTDENTGSGDVINKDSEKNLSDGEISSHESTEVEAVDLKPEVVCISDDEGKSKKKKKKEKKKKDKKSKKKDFRESADQNFFKDQKETTEPCDLVDENECKITVDSVNLIENIEDDVYEILELSDDSSCYEVEGTVLSKEPTVEEIAALSAKIDAIEREDVITEEEIKEHEKQENEEPIESLENVSWKDRYLDSTKVKKVLTTSNILNALRKKNKELKKKLEDSKKKEQEIEPKSPEVTQNKELEEGSIEHYNTLEGSTKYVNPVKEGVDTEKESQLEKEEEYQKIEIEATGELKKDAKQLLKMYKKLLKYNDMKKQKDPSKKKKKKVKKKEK